MPVTHHDTLNSVRSEKNGRPTLGLALGGGAARGWAHIGVLEVLTENGIVPDVIAGTSIGAVSGGAFSAGKLAELKTFALSLTSRRVFSLVDLTPLSNGLIAGKKLEARLAAHMAGLRLEELPIRTVFIAAELATGHEIWLRRGDLIRLMQASYALPGVFHPIQINGRALVDGALVNPVPVSVCRAYGARLVIAVDLSPENRPHGGVVPDLPDFEGDSAMQDTQTNAEETTFGWKDVTGFANPFRKILRSQFGAVDDDGPRGIPAVMMQSFTIIQDRLTRMRLAGDPPDTTIAPHVGGIGMFDFHKAEEAIAAGRAAATRALDDIAALTERLSTK
ncbi:MAG: patatin-like phospholipase family protein [Hyphomicrobiales bacterium]